jgi:hypothetical protein
MVEKGRKEGEPLSVPFLSVPHPLRRQNGVGESSMFGVGN